jgi:hypothetical protein
MRSKGRIGTVDSASEVELQPGDPRSKVDAALIERFSARMLLPIIVSAILPLIVVPKVGEIDRIVVEIASRRVFLVDYLVHVRRLNHFGRTGMGHFDPFVVVATARWYLFRTPLEGSIVVALGLARLARLAVATNGTRRLFERLGRVAVVVLGVIVIGSLVAYYADRATTPSSTRLATPCGGAS